MTEVDNESSISSIYVIAYWVPIYATTDTVGATDAKELVKGPGTCYSSTS